MRAHDPHFFSPVHTNSPFFAKRNAGETTGNEQPLPATDHTTRIHPAVTDAPSIQRNGEDDSLPPAVQEVAPGNSPEYLAIRDAVISHACSKMAEIRQAAENGWVWHFENEDLLLGSEMLDRGVPGARPLADQRIEVLSSTVLKLAQLIAEVENGHYAITFATSQPYSDLAAHVEGLQMQWGLSPYEPLPWTAAHGGANAGYLSYIRQTPGGTPVLPPASLAWWAPALPAACSPAGTVEETAGTARVHTTRYWAHVPDIVHQPAQVDRIDTDYPRSGTTLRTPPTGTTRIGGRGDSFPLMREGNLYFYMLNGQRINLPALQQRFPQLTQ